MELQTELSVVVAAAAVDDDYDNDDTDDGDFLQCCQNFRSHMRFLFLADGFRGQTTHICLS
jgi:hypothetical protein